MSDEKALWTTIQSIHEKIRTDAKFAAAFDKDPVDALKQANLDPVVPETKVSPKTQFSKLLAGMTEIERRATIEAVAGVRPGGHQALALAVANANAGANANVGANANALANANANANANTNTNGFAAADLQGDLVRLVIGQNFARTDLATRLTNLKLSPARQQALLKSVFSDGQSIVSRQGASQKAIASFRGLSFEVEATVKGAEIEVTGGRILQ